MGLPINVVRIQLPLTPYSLFLIPKYKSFYLIIQTFVKKIIKFVDPVGFEPLFLTLRVCCHNQLGDEGI